MNNKPSMPAFIPIGFIVLSAAMLALIVYRQSPPASARLNPQLAAQQLTIPPFQFTERDGEPFGGEDLKGKIWIADFIFTACAGPCPMMSIGMSDLQERLEDFDDVRLVSFSVDPERDTPEVLREYAERYGASERWAFLTGDRYEIYTLAEKSFKLTVMDRSEGAGEDDQTVYDHVILHSDRFVLIDQHGRIRGFYNGLDEQDRERLARAALALARDLRVPPRIAPLPSVNATFNGCSALLLAAGYVLIRRGRPRQHRIAMLSAFGVSVLFLTSYLVYHRFALATPFAGRGAVRYAYYAMLLSHVVLAVAIVPLVLTTLYYALRDRREKHRRIARITLPLWLYVSITGVLVYWVLYHAYPPPGVTL